MTEPHDATSPEARAEAPGQRARDRLRRPVPPRRGDRSDAPGLLERFGAAGRRVVGVRSIGGWLLAAALVLLPSAAWGVSTASAQGNLGPHTARYDVTLDGEVTVDLGPLGTLVIDSPLPLALGARVVVQEIPQDVTAIEAATSLESLSSALEEYVAFFTGPEATIQVAVRALVADAVQRTLLGAIVLSLGLVVLRALLGADRRAELKDHARPHRRSLAAGGAIVVLLVTTVVGSEPVRPGGDRERLASAVFAGTPLEGARITGRLAGVVDTYGGQAVAAWRENERFYAAADDAVRAAWQARAERDQVLVDIRRRLGTAPPTPDRADGDPSPSPSTRESDASSTGPGTPTDGPAGEEPGDDPGDVPDLVTMLVVSDLHCNVGMARVMGTVAGLAEVDVVLDAGDTTVNGTAVESYCVQAFTDALPDGVAKVVANGNHDSAVTADQQRRLDWVVLDGEVVEVAGVRILGDADPRATRIGSGTSLVGDETVAALGERLAETACTDAGGVDLVLVHDPLVGRPVLAGGCAPAQVSGHYHRREGPVRAGLGTRFTSASTAGALLGRPTVGPLSGTAELTVLRFDPRSRRVVDYRLVLVHADATASVSAPLRWPHDAPRLTPDRPLR